MHSEEATAKKKFLLFQRMGADLVGVRDTCCLKMISQAWKFALRGKNTSTPPVRMCKLSAPMFEKMYASFAASESQSANDNFFTAD
jgi:hypothetical protein